MACALHALHQSPRNDVIIDINDQIDSETESDDETEAIAAISEQRPGVQIFRLDNGMLLAIYPDGSKQILPAGRTSQKKS